MKLYTVDTGYFKLDGGAMFGTVPKSIWNKTYPADSNNLCNLAMRCLLIVDEGRKILIDTGIGDKQNETFFSHYYLDKTHTLDNSLQKLGFTADDITDVILTHLHLDHAGGAVVREGNDLIPRFKNAVYWTNQKHLQHALVPNEREKHSFLKENIEPLQAHGVLQYIKTETNIAFNKNIRLQFYYGHTEAMIVPIITYENKTLAYVADLISLAGHLPISYVTSYDIRPLHSFEEKKRFLSKALNNNYTLFLEHDPLHECISIQNTAKGIRLQNSFSLNDFLKS